MFGLSLHFNQHLRSAIGTGISCFLFLFVLAVVPGHAQFNSSIRGVVSDPSGRLVQGGLVSLKNVATSLTYSATTDATGSYIFPSLGPGNYELTIKMAGFSTVIIQSVLETNQELSLPVNLTVATAAQTVNVTSESPLLDTSDSRLQATLPSSQIETLPMQGRTVIGLTSLA